ncbi:LanC-like protein [Drosera capensis]
MSGADEVTMSNQTPTISEKKRKQRAVSSSSEMGDRCFHNEMPPLFPQASSLPFPSQVPEDSLTGLLYLPFDSLCEKLKTSAMRLKELVVRETWWRNGKQDVKDYTLYTGALGTAFLLFKAFQVSGDPKDLSLCSEIVEACDLGSRGSKQVTFICGRSGVCALGAVVAKQSHDIHALMYYLNEFKKIRLPRDLPNELLYGRTGYLWSCLFLNKNIGEETISSTSMRPVVSYIIDAGRRLGKREGILMYEWHGKKYWGAAHGLVGIMHVLMDMDLKPDEQEDVKNTLKYMIQNRFPSRNYPSSEGSETDRLVHWCHGAPGVALAMVKAAKVFGNQEFFQAAEEAAEVVWDRGLLKRIGICHGISGNTYVFLALFQLTGKPEYLHKAKAFASFLYDRAQTLVSEGLMHGGDRPYSLFEGLGGMAHLFLDMNNPYEARFPAYEL